MNLELRELEFKEPGKEHGELEPPDYGNLLHLSLRVIGDSPSMSVLACLIKNKWNVCGKIEITKFRASTFSVGFTEATDYLRCSGRTWEMILDSSLLISRAPPEQFHEQAFDSVHQWQS